MHGKRPHAALAQSMNRRYSLPLGITKSNRHIRARIGQSQSNRLTQPFSAAGDERGPARQWFCGIRR